MTKQSTLALAAAGVIAAAVIAALVLMMPKSEVNDNANAPTNVVVNQPSVNEPTSPPPAPEQPVTKKGEKDMIRVRVPQPGDVVTSPLTTEGEARGNWYFEASFPMKLLDGNGKVIATSHAEAQSEWMTPEYVPFKGTIKFTKPTTAEGTLVLEKDNPSGLPEHDDELRVPVRFQQAAPIDAKHCRRTGCSSQVCADEDVMTTCEFRPEYACYRTAMCERQPDGKCGWTQNAVLTQCLSEAGTLQ